MHQYQIDQFTHLPSVYTMTKPQLVTALMLSCLYRLVPAFSVSSTPPLARTTTSLAAATTLDNGGKRIVFIRHGCTYMNEYLVGCSYGSPNFTDVFPMEQVDKYHDTVLSPRGQQQAKALSSRLTPVSSTNPATASSTLAQEFDLILVSPLTRALQTFDIGVKPHVADQVTVMAVPLASERCWLISDIGRPRSHLLEEYPYCDFETAFWKHGSSNKEDDTFIEEWWFGLDDCRTVGRAVPTGTTSASYQEWRPIGQGQTYACPGEPEEHFDARMNQFYRFLQNRPESTIAVVCHWGVIQWMLGVDFENCELRVVPFDQIMPKGIAMLEEVEQLEQVRQK